MEDWVMDEERKELCARCGTESIFKDMNMNNYGLYLCGICTATCSLVDARQRRCSVCNKDFGLNGLIHYPAKGVYACVGCDGKSRHGESGLANTQTSSEREGCW
jgi:hypothetical protein